MTKSVLALLLKQSFCTLKSTCLVDLIFLSVTTVTLQTDSKTTQTYNVLCWLKKYKLSALGS